MLFIIIYISHYLVLKEMKCMLSTFSLFMKENVRVPQTGEKELGGLQAMHSSLPSAFSPAEAQLTLTISASPAVD